MRNRYNNYVIEEERSFQEGNTSVDHPIPNEDQRGNTMNFDEMADDMFDIQVSPHRGQNINHIQQSLTSNRGTIKKSDQKNVLNDNNYNTIQPNYRPSQFNIGRPSKPDDRNNKMVNQ